MAVWWTVPRLSQEGGRVAVVSDDVTKLVTDLSVTVLLREVQAQKHGTIQIGRGLVLLRSGGAKDFVSHADIIGTGQDRSRVRVDTSRTGTGWLVWGPLGSTIRGQRKEGRGSPDDEKGRHAPCSPVIIKKYKKKGGNRPPILYANINPSTKS